MKRVKIMLMSIAVLAVVGGALAFNTKLGFKICYAKNFYGTGVNKTCVTVPSGQTERTTIACTDEINARTIAVGTDICYTPVALNGDCTDLCPTLGTTVAEAP